MSPRFDPRSRYLSDSSSTASPAKLVIMLYDALVRDLALAEQAIVEESRETAHERLVHAQAVVLELFASLDTQQWDGGPGLARLYLFLVNELVAANINKSVERVRACAGLVTPLRDAWAEAYVSMHSPAVIGTVA
ncbi:MAG: flagellar export chaperone FliS [Acidimicrobiia bacterium]